ncbi:MAG TPA: trypsin-like peptidase domain-containing protein [Actinomycetota bacterium]|jgi:S1-C subfamily serine protease
MADHDQDHDTEEFELEPAGGGDREPAGEPEHTEPEPEHDPAASFRRDSYVSPDDRYGFRTAGSRPATSRHWAPAPAARPGAEGSDDWFWWTDGETSRPVTSVPPRPDRPMEVPEAWGRTTPNAPWSSTPIGWHGPQHAQPRRGRAGAIVAAVVASAVLIASGVGIGWGLSQPGSRSGAFTNPPLSGNVGGSNPNVGGGSNPTFGGKGGSGDGTTNGNGGGSSTSPRQVAQGVLPAVVVIRTVIGTGAPGLGPQGAAAGTGMILTSSGEVLTNNHVIRGSTGIEATTSNGQTYDAHVIGADPADDVALIQLDGASDLPTIRTDTGNLTEGTSVVAIGNAYGTGNPSATGGTVTGLNQTITAGDPGSPSERLHGVIQTNAPIAPGDSGGPLVDTQGEVIGMITAATQTSGFTRTSTQGYAITIGDALNIVHRIQSGDTSGGDIVYGRPGLLGVQVRNLSAAAAARLGLSTGGAYVEQVVPGTPAANAGMQTGSVITNIDGHDIGSAKDVSDVMHSTKPGDSASISWVDTSGPHSATVHLIEAPAV